MSEFKVASVVGMSTLRGKEDQAKKGSAERDNSRARYLSKYISSNDQVDGKDGKKKKRKKKTKSSRVATVQVLDEDFGWPAEQAHSGDVNERRHQAAEDEEEEGPVVENAAEVQHQLKLMQSQQQFQSQWEGEPSAGAEKNAAARTRHDSDDDSPPRRGTSTRAEKNAAARTRHDSDDDSPPRRGTSTRAEKNAAGRARHDSDDDSPPRRGTSTRTEKNASGRARHDSDDDSPPRRGTSTRAEKNASGRVRRNSDDDSPPRRGTSTDRGLERTAEAPLAGLVTPQEMAKQIREDRERRANIDAVAAGRDASVAYRVQGRAVSKEEFQEAQNARQPKKQKRFIEEDVAWKGGLVQQKAAEAQERAQQDEGQKKFQRGFDEAADADLQQELRMEDPMAAYFASKQMDALSAADAAAPSAVYESELAGGSGFSVPQLVPDHSWIRRGVQPLPNRYKIKPGRHWDGVHRSNGFEQKFVFQYRNKKAERARDEYVLAEDM